MSIYTRAGDKGKTSLSSGQRVLKSDLRIECLGSIDELNSVIGVAISEIRNELENIQSDLLEIGSILASQGQALQGLEKRVKGFENLIDEMTKHLPKLNNFILPGGGKTGATLHLARAVCRRVERRMVELNNKEKLDKNIIIYFNRLSDLLFVMARFANFQEKKTESIWIKKK
jgi:cob(I)alamin adenosyltransferase